MDVQIEQLARKRSELDYSNSDMNITIYQMRDSYDKLLNKYYKTGEITIKVNPERVDYCENLLKIKALPARIAGNVKIAPEDTIGKSDCTLAWNETELEYSQEQITKDTDAILEHLNMKLSA